MDAKTKASAAVAHIQDPRVKAIRLRSLTKLFENLDQIKNHADDESAFENANQDYRNDDSDGVESITPEQFQENLKTKRQTLRVQARHMAFDNLDDGDALSVAVETDENDINRRGTYGYTPLIAAAVRGDLEECRRLKELGADLRLIDTSRKMAWEKAQSRGFTVIANLLKPV